LSEGSIIGALSYAALQGAFARELATAADGGAGPIWVLVPTNLLALHLRRSAAAAGGGVAGVEFMTLKDAAGRVALVRMASEGRRPMPEGAPEVAVQRLLAAVPDGSYLSALRPFINGAPAVLRAIQVLDDSLWSPEALMEAAPATAARDAAAPQRLRELAALWADWRAWKAQRRLYEAADLVRNAARTDREPAQRPATLLLYGFYDFAPAQRALVERLVGLAARCSAYLLWDGLDGEPAPGFEYAGATVAWLTETLGCAGVEYLERSPAETDLQKLRALAFHEHPLLPAEEAHSRLAQCAGGFDGTVRVVSCPGAPSEAAEAVREALRAVRAGGASLTVGVLLRGVEEGIGLLAEAFGRSGIRWYAREGLPLEQTCAGRVALSLLELAGGDAERTAVVDFLGLARVEWPADLSASALDRVARQAGVIRGWGEWTRRLRRRAEQLARDAARAEDELDAAALGADVELCGAARGFLDEFFGKLAPLKSPPSWREAARHLRALTEAHAPQEDAGTAPVLEVIEGLAALEVTGAPCGDDAVRWVLGRRLSRQSLKRERFQHVGAAVSSIMAARGATFDVVVVPGLVEKGFPRHAPTSALLTELDREALNDVAHRHRAGELPLQAARPLEERYLFRIALGSAERAAVLTHYRLEQGGGRPRLPSRFLLEACSALSGCTVTASMVEEGLPAGLVRRVPLNQQPWDREELELALDAFEYDAGVFTGPTGSARRTGYMSAVCEIFRRAQKTDALRWGTSNFGPCDGKIRAEDLLEGLREKHGRFSGPISPSRLEMYARCPFEYFLAYVLGVEEVEAPPEEFELPALERGSLVHDVLRRVYEDNLKGRRLGDLTDQEIQALAAAAGSALDALGQVHAENHPATWAAERERTLDRLRAMLLRERNRHADAVPEAFELEFGFGGAERFSLQIGPDAAVTFRGRIDRIDGLPDGAIQVVDYKTGRPGKYRKNSLAGGLQLQLPIYLLAARGRMDASAASALYLMFDGPKDVPQFTLAELEERMESFRAVLRLIVEGIRGGDFFPLPAQPGARRACDKYCRFRGVCGAARQSLAEIKQDDPDAAPLRRLRSVQ
jgi:RecB family exonuclease